MFKRTILAAIAVSMLAVPMAQAQNRYDGPRLGHRYAQPEKPQFYAPQRQHMQKRHEVQKTAPQRHHAQKPVPQRKHWARGQSVPDWRRKPPVQDYHRHGLKRPANGQQWVRIDNDFLLISLATGVILGLAASR